MMEKNLLWGILVFLHLSICCCFYEPNSLPDIGNADFIDECVSVHNRFRSNVNPPASNMQRMTWDYHLAKTANAWAKKCQFEHNKDIKIPGKTHPNFTTLGENIWTGSFWLFSVTSALTDWQSEVQYYNYGTQQCSHVCGHYTQMVWATSNKVGCAVHFCPEVTGFGRNAAHFICNYGPSGNYRRQPYNRGPACSKCHGEPCIDKLCGKLWADSSCDKYCITILVLRPTLTLLTLGAVLFIQKRFPTMHVCD